MGRRRIGRGREPRFQVRRDDGVVRLAGELTIREGPLLWRELREHVRDPGEGLTFDLAGVQSAEGGALALLVELRCELAARGIDVSVSGANERVARLLDLYAYDAPCLQPSRRRPEPLVAQVGRIIRDWSRELGTVVAFLGTGVLAGRAIARRPRAAHLADIPHLVERAGTDAVPIVALINFLVGFVMAFQSASQLIRFGANLYVADLVGLSMTRELAPLMTAIIVLGRSGAAYAAEIGSMKVSEEIDALRTLGLSPFAWLVIPRTITLVLVTPVLTLLADFLGLFGGLLVAVTSLDQTTEGYLAETKTAVTLWDVQSGLIKSAAFGLVIALIACQQGFAASGGAEGVGRRTTSTVVTSLFVLVLVDTAFTVFYRSLGLLP